MKLTETTGTNNYPFINELLDALYRGVLFLIPGGTTILDLTGGSLISYLLRVCSDVVNKNQRFRAAIGDVKVTYNNRLHYKDVQVLVKDVSASGNRLSPDFFMCTKIGRAILTKVAGKDGSFIEWVSETDATRQTPESGVYYLEVDKVNEENNEVILILQKYRWLEGHLKNAVGSTIYFRSGINPTLLTLTNTATGTPLVDGTDYISVQGKIVLITPVVSISITDLTPLADYWYLRQQEVVLFPSTTMGTQSAYLPVGTVSFTLTDPTGYQLRMGPDYTTPSGTTVQLGQWTPAGKTVTAQILTKADPSATSAIHPENNLNLTTFDDEHLVPGQVFIHTPSGDYTSMVTNSDGTASLPSLLQPGDWLRWEVRVNHGLCKKKAKKYSLNGGVIPGLNLAMGDNVLAGDQCGIIVSPTQTETYHVYGSKENVTFTLEVKANDLQTASDLTEALKAALLVTRRETMEADGITIFESPRSYQGGSRDTSGTAPSYVYTMSFSAACDWKVFVPLVTRLVNFEVTATPGFTDFSGKIELLNGKPIPVAKTLGVTGFLVSYQ